MNDLIDKLKSLNLSKKSIFNQGEPNGPNDPDTWLILYLLDVKEINKEEDTTVPYKVYLPLYNREVSIHKGSTIEEIFRALGCYGTYLAFWSEDPLSQYNYVKDDDLPKILEFSKKVEQHNETADVKDSKYLKKKGLALDKGCFPDIYTYINGFSFKIPINLISPTMFLYMQYYYLDAYTLEFNTLLLCKGCLDKELLESQKDLGNKSAKFWYLRQVSAQQGGGI